MLWLMLPLNPLNEFQRKGYAEVVGLSNKNVCLLHGVTSSGKTKFTFTNCRCTGAGESRCCTCFLK